MYQFQDVGTLSDVNIPLIANANMNEHKQQSNQHFKREAQKPGLPKFLEQVS